MRLLVIFQNFFVQAEAGGAFIGYFAAHKCAIRDDIAHILYYFNIRIEIQASIVIQNPKASIITNKRPFLRLIRFSNIFTAIQIKIVFIPLFDFIIRKILFPATDTFNSNFRQRISAKPTIMYNLWNHIVLTSFFTSELSRNSIVPKNNSAKFLPMKYIVPSYIDQTKNTIIIIAKTISFSFLI